MTPTLVQILARELREQLVSARLSHISQSAPETVDLAFHHPDRDQRHLTVALLPLRPLLFLSPERPAAMPKPPNFCRSLRKHLEYAQLVRVEAEPGERILTLVLKAQEGEWRLVFEGIPKYPNLILGGPDGGIVSALRYKNDVERPVVPGEPYRPPPRGEERPNLWDLAPTELRVLWEKDGKPGLAGWFRDRLRGSDTELSGYLDLFQERAFDHWATVKREILEEGWKRFIFFPGPPPSLRVFPVKTPDGKESLSFERASEALHFLFQSETLHRRFLAARARLESELARAVRHEKRLLEKLRKDLAEAEKADQYQWWGELLMAQLHKVLPHRTEAELPDVIRGGPDPVRVPLDPEATPLENAQRFFKRAKKGVRGLAVVQERQGKVQERLGSLQAAQRSLPALRAVAELEKAYRDLFPAKESAAKAAASRPARKGAAERVPTPNIRRERIAKGFELCVGTSAAANEQVTFQLAQPEDLWFHVRDLPGSHVVLRRLERSAEMTEELILEAAKRAAAQSKAGPGEKVTVTYTERKNVKRIPGAPMGMVSVSKERTVTLEVRGSDLKI